MKQGVPQCSSDQRHYIKWHEQKLFSYESARNAPLNAPNGACLHSMPVFFDLSPHFTSEIYQKTPHLVIKKTECCLLGLLKLNFEKGTEWCGACTRWLCFFLEFSRVKISKVPLFRDQLTECFHLKTTFFKSRAMNLGKPVLSYNDFVKLLQVKLPYEPVCPSFGCFVGRLVGLSVC